MRSADAIRIALAAPDFVSIDVGKVFPSPSADSATAHRNAIELDAHPKFWAEHGPKSLLIEPSEHAALLADGATPRQFPRRIEPE